MNACRAAIGIRVGEHSLTRLEDTWANTIRHKVNANAYSLARWFAESWWRLRWEPETSSSQENADWLMSHSMGSVGGGFSWPSILFVSDGDSMTIASRASRDQVMGPVRYLAEISERIQASEFESGVDSFLSLVLSRLDAEGFALSELNELWKEVTNERANPQLASIRRMEAICGYDPDEAPASLLDLLLKDTYQLGKIAVEEVAAHKKHATQAALNDIRSLAITKRSPSSQSGGFRAHPQTLKTKPKGKNGMRPWERAAILARHARKEWNIGDEPISNMDLTNIFKVSEKKLKDTTRNISSVPLSLGLRGIKDDSSLDIYIDKRFRTSRRFAACRILGQWLDVNGDAERLIPVADAKTAQQQFQRAFAQEFLCPYEALINRMQSSQPSPEDIEEAADYFGVSSQLVETTLINKGDMDRGIKTGRMSRAW
jgi:hypothetical protein